MVLGSKIGQCTGISCLAVLAASRQEYDWPFGQTPNKNKLHTPAAVSYTHLDVYKRQNN